MITVKSEFAAFVYQCGIGKLCLNKTPNLTRHFAMPSYQWGPNPKAWKHAMA